MEESRIIEGAVNIYVWGQEDEPERANNAEGFFRYLFNYALQHVPFKPGSLELIVVALPEELKDAIHWAQERAGAIKGFTSEEAGEDAFHQTGAKTIAHLHPNGTVVSTIVINKDMLALIGEEMSKNLPSLHDWNEAAQFFLYAIVHELGHVYDNYVRHDYEGNKVDIFNEDDWQLLAKHCSAVVVGEFLACYYAAPAVAPELQQRMVESFYEEFDFYLEDLIRRRDNYVYNAELAAVHSLWMIISQFAKLVGHRANNKDLAAFPLWKDAEDDKKSLFKDIETLLLNEFPQRREDSSLDEFAHLHLTPLWRRLAALYGFEFED